MTVHAGCRTLMDAGGKGRQGRAATAMTLMGSGAWEFMRAPQRSWTLTGAHVTVHDGCATLIDAHGAVRGKERRGSAATTMTLMSSGEWEFMRVPERSWTLMGAHDGP